MKYSIILLSLGLTIQTSLQAGAFTNLDFESANTNNLTVMSDIYYSGTTKDLIPGWTLKDKNGVEMTTIFYNSETPGGLPHAFLVTDGGLLDPVDGKYAFIMVGGAADPLFLSQTGTIPNDSKYINFTSHDHVSLSIDGTPLQINEVQIWVDNPFNPRKFKYQAWADITAYAGQEVALSFGSDSFGCGPDNIQFTTTVVPEPSTVVLFGLGGLAFLGRRMQNRKKRDEVFF
jgi:hypothetical protein